MRYWLEVDEYENPNGGFASVRVKVEETPGGHESFFIAVNSDNYELAGYTVSISDLCSNIEEKDYVDIDLTYSDIAIKPSCASDSIPYEYDSFSLYQKWWKEIDHEEFKQRVKKKIIDSLI